MNMIFDSGKLNSHDNYLEMLGKLKKETKYIEIVVIDKDDSNELRNKFSKDIILYKKVYKWWAAETRTKHELYRIKPSKELFAYLKRFETFCKYYDDCGVNEENSENDDNSEGAYFGLDDIAFYDEEGEYLLYTLTHEGVIEINDRLIEMYNR